MLPTATALSDPFVAQLLHHVRRCELHRPDVHALSECANLAVAGTGSETLSHLITAAASPHAHHAHVKRIRDFPTTRCFLTTLRDPAERLESGYRFESVHDEFSKTNLHNSLSGGFPTLGAFVHALRNASAPLHARALLLYQRSVVHPAEDFQRSMATLPNCWRFTSGAASRVVQKRPSDKCTGSNFLVPQVDYLVGADCTRAELHLLCTHDLQAGWHQLQRHFVDNATAPARTPPNADATARTAAANGTHLHAREAELGGAAVQRSRLSEEERTFVRDCLYPHDTRLYRDICETMAALH